MARRKSKIIRLLYWTFFIAIVVIALYNCISDKQFMTHFTDEPQYTESQPQDSKQPSQSKIVNKGEIPEGIEIPLCPYHKDDHERRDFNYYSICYRESYEQAEWSAYKLTKDQLANRVNRTDDFRPDPSISTGSADLADYKKSGYDRGHLTPAADREMSQEAVSETFYMSNMSPQFPAFNREIWQYLEHQVRVWAEKFGTVYVISGPVLEKPAGQYASIGHNKVSIPQYYYKVILAQNNDTPIAIGFILENKKHRDKNFWDDAVTIDEVEQRTGLDFWSLLEDSTENAVEASFDISLWK